jgi:hypothetical protein
MSNERFPGLTKPAPRGHRRTSEAARCRLLANVRHERKRGPIVRKTATAFLALPAACALSLATAGAASAAETYEIDLEALNDSGATGSAMITADEDAGTLTVSIEATGLTPNAPHAQHIHGGGDGTMDFVCPTMDADANGDGVVDTVEGLPSYGDIFVSLTTEGDATAASGLAVDRFPVADGEGNVSYERTFTTEELPEGAIEFVQNLHVVQHGIDLNGNGEYDGEIGALTAGTEMELPLEATVPANCGMVEGSTIIDKPAGGVETGGGTTEGTQAVSLFALGGVSLAAAGGVMVARRRFGAES